jgi:hypothetical protein
MIVAARSAQLCLVSVNQAALLKIVKILIATSNKRAVYSVLEEPTVPGSNRKMWEQHRTCLDGTASLSIRVSGDSGECLGPIGRAAAIRRDLNAYMPLYFMGRLRETRIFN